MPQMSPLNWMVLFFMTIFIYLIYLILTYYMLFYKNSNNSFKKPIKYIYSWKW